MEKRFEVNEFASESNTIPVEVRELDESQLALVGGGIGETVLA